MPNVFNEPKGYEPAIPELCTISVATEDAVLTFSIGAGIIKIALNYSTKSVQLEV